MANLSTLHLPWGDMAFTFFSSALLIVSARLAYNVFLHPLRNVPGPLLWAATPLPWAYHMVRGSYAQAVRRLHGQYGTVVRTRPGELSFATPQAWRDIYSMRTKAAEAAGRPRELHKFLPFYRPNAENIHGLVTMDRERHGLMRAALAHGFSDKSMQAQEPTLMAFIDKMTDKLRARAAGPDDKAADAIDISKWLNYTTFDIVSELTYGEPFGCLDLEAYHPMPQLLFDYIPKAIFTRVMRVLGVPSQIQVYLSSVANPNLLKIKNHNTRVLQKRLEMGSERDHDFVSGIVKEQRNGETFTMPEIQLTLTTVITAGAETTATLLTAVVYLLLANPEAMAQVVAEVRGAFASDKDISILSVGQLKYMGGCLSEALRHYPPVPFGMPRQVPAGFSDILDGVHVPSGTVVSVPQFTINHDPNYWTEPESFLPERWLGGERFKNDRFDAMNPFSLGPRNCIGKNLAYTEMRLMLAKVLYNFDLELAPESKDWMAGQTAYILWHKPPLNVKLQARA